MKYIRQFKLFTIIPWLLLSGSASFGTTFMAADCSLNSISNAVFLATNGDTVLLPAGTGNWTTGLTISNKGINLIGAGMTQTFITNAWATGTSSQSLLVVKNTSSNFVHISGFTICNSSGAYSSLQVVGTSSFSPICFRIDHVQFTNISGAGIQPLGYALGVIDHCSFSTVTNGGATGISMTGEGAYSWDTRPPTWGDTNKVYIEDCTFNWSAAAMNANGAVDSYNGARWCFRHNWVTNINVGCHGTDSTGSERSTHSYEVYNNFFTNTTAHKDLFLGGFRGGTGIFFSNTIVGYVEVFIGAVVNYRNTGTNIYGVTYPTWSVGTAYGPGTNVQISSGTDYVCILANTGNEPPNPTYWRQFFQTPCCTPWGPVDGVNPLDGNTDPYGYPAYDSIGRTSPTVYYTNVPTPSYTNYAFGLAATNLFAFLTNSPWDYTTNNYEQMLTNLLAATNGFTVQAPQPMYAWSNFVNGADCPISNSVVFINTGNYFLIPPAQAVIQSGRDYFNDTIMTNYVLYAISNNALVSVATNVYTPLVYPHPLVTAATVMPPSNLHTVP